jgi:predicted transcriptional regulator
MTKTKNKILIGLNNRGEANSARELEVLAGTDEHNLIHLLWALKKQGLIGFKVDKRGKVNEPRKIVITKQGKDYLRKQA